MAPGIAVIMVVGSGALLAASWWLVEAVAPRWMTEQVRRKVTLHSNVVAAMNVAIPRAGNDVEMQARLIANRDWHLAALARLDPTEAARFDTPALAKAA